MAGDVQPANPFGGGLSVRPIGGGGPTLYHFALAALTLYLIMRYVPHGVEVGLIVLFGVFLSTPAAVQSVAGLLQWIQNPSL